jgi:hypothetical protein
VLLVSAAMLLALAAYANAFRGPFTYDDQAEVVNNESIERLNEPISLLRRNLTRPLTNLTYAIDFRMWGGRNVVGFHATNILLHTVNVGLLFAMTWTLVGRREKRESERSVAAFAAASLFAVHPLMTEAVSYVSSRSDLLVTLWVTAAFLLFWRGFLGRPRAFIGGWLAFAAGLLTKETAAVFPFLLLAGDAWLGEPGGWRRRVARVYLPLFGIIAIGAGYRIWLYLAVENARASTAGWDQAFIAGEVAIRYLGLLLLPWGQTVVHTVYHLTTWRDPRVAILASVSVVLVLGLVTVRRRAPIVLFAAAWFFLTLAPSSLLSLLAAVGQPMAEHRAYLPSVGFFLAVGWAAARLAEWMRGRFAAPMWILAAAGVCVLGALSALTVRRNAVWADPVALWREATVASPTIAASHLGLAEAYRSTDDCAQAEPEYARVIELRPSDPLGYRGLADCLIARGRVDDAVSLLRMAAGRLPADAEVRMRLAGILEQTTRDAEETLRLCREALSIDPQSRAASNCIARHAAQ